MSLTRKDLSFIWNLAHQHSFELLKKALASTSVLANFDTDMPTLVTTDASSVALDANLSQIHRDCTERTVAFASRMLFATERAYPPLTM